MESQVLITSDIGCASYLLARRSRILRLQLDPSNPRSVQLVFSNQDEEAARAQNDYEGGGVVQATRIIDCYRNLKSMVMNFRDNMRGAR